MNSQTQNNPQEHPFRMVVRLLNTSRAFIPWYVILLVGGLTSSLVGLGAINAFRQIANGATGHNIHLLWNGVIIGIGSSLVLFVIDWLRSYGENWLDVHSTLNLQATMLKTISRARLSELERFHSGDIIARMTDSATEAQTGVNGTALKIVSNLLQILVMLGYLFALNVSLAIGTIAISATVPLLLNPISSRVRKIYVERQKTEAANNALVQDAMQGAEVVRAYSLADRLTGRLADGYTRVLELTRRVLVFESLMNVTQIAVVAAGVLFDMGYGGWLVKQHVLDIGSLVAFLFSFERVANPLATLAHLWPQFQQSLASAHRVFHLLDLEVEPTAPSKQGRSVFGSFKAPSIVCSDVHFSYHNGPETLRGVTFRAEAGQVTALVGSSGAGKSTLIKLLLRFYEPTAGEVLCEDQLITTVDAATWRQSIGYVAQDATLFSGTIGDNIRMGNPEASEAEMIAAAKLASIHDWIATLPAGYATPIGERGLGLSGGQRQRVSIARALLKNPPLLLLDEPTSSLDSESEQAVQQALRTLMRNRTTIIVAHRLSTIRDAHRIVVLDHGQVAEEGTHETLLRTNGRYRELYEAMSRVTVDRSDIWSASTERDHGATGQTFSSSQEVTHP